MSSNSDEDEVEVTDEDVEKITRGTAIVGVAFIVGGFLGIFVVPEDPGAGFLAYGLIFAIGAWLLGTETGREVLQICGACGDEQQQQQQQTISTNSRQERKMVCPKCGWENFADNNFCNDCGHEFEE